MRKWKGYDFPDQDIVIAGLCSVSDRQSTLDTMKVAAEKGVHLFRAGIWKPRTSPFSFEGVGFNGIEWLREGREKYGVPFAVEVGSIEHCRLLLPEEPDVIWIGARTTASPFAVEEIARYLQWYKRENDREIPIMIKNPISNDLGLWEGAVERFESKGLTQIALVHRGVNSGKYPIKYRNLPVWDHCRKISGYTVINDISHIAGSREHLLDVAIRGIVEGFDGIMVEIHVNPMISRSDKKQVASPEILDEIRNLFGEPYRKISIFDLRNDIDHCDSQIIAWLNERLEISKKIGLLKRESERRISDKRREYEIQKKINEFQNHKQIKSVYDEIIVQSKILQVLNNSNNEQ